MSYERSMQQTGQSFETICTVGGPKIIYIPYKGMLMP